MEERSVEVLRELLDCSWFVAGNESPVLKARCVRVEPATVVRGFGSPVPSVSFTMPEIAPLTLQRLSRLIRRVTSS
jgi:hypothetical protein